MSRALSEALSAVSGAERRALIRSIGEMESASSGLLWLLLGLRAELLADVAAEDEFLHRVQRDMYGGNGFSEPGPSDGSVLSVDPDTPE